MKLVSTCPSLEALAFPIAASEVLMVKSSEGASKRMKREILKELPPIPNCRFLLAEIHQTFTDRSSLGDADRLWLLTRLFFAVASQVPSYSYRLPVLRCEALIDRPVTRVRTKPK